MFSLAFQFFLLYCLKTFLLKGEKTDGGVYIFTSCTSNLTIEFSTPEVETVYRGFNIYYEGNSLKRLFEMHCN